MPRTRSATSPAPTPAPRLAIRFTDAELRAIRAAADVDGRTVSGWLRRLALVAVGMQKVA